MSNTYTMYFDPTHSLAPLVLLPLPLDPPLQCFFSKLFEIILFLLHVHFANKMLIYKR